MNDLLSLLEMLAGDFEFWSANEENNIKTLERKSQDYYSKFKSIYSNGFRHKYSKLSNFSETKLKADTRTILNDLLSKILECSIKESESSDTTKSLQKLLDHLQLESIRINRFEQLKELESDFVKNVKNSDEMLNRSDEQLRNVEDRVNGLMQQIISIIGIFSGIVVAFTVSSSMFSGVFENINDLNIWRVLLTFDIFAMILFNLLFMLLFCVSKLSGRSIAIRENHGVVKKEKSLSDFLYRFPYVKWTNIIFIILGIILFCFVLLKIKYPML